MRSQWNELKHEIISLWSLLSIFSNSFLYWKLHHHHHSQSVVGLDIQWWNRIFEKPHRSSLYTVKIVTEKNRIKFSLNYLFWCCSWFGKIRFILHDRIDIIVVMVEDSFLIFNFWSIINFLRNSILFQFLIWLDFLVCLVSWAIILCVICVMCVCLSQFWWINSMFLYCRNLSITLSLFPSAIIN